MYYLLMLRGRGEDCVCERRCDGERERVCMCVCVRVRVCVSSTSPDDVMKTFVR